MSFDTLAPHYRTLELILAGALLQRCRTAFLKETVNCRNAVLLGEGPGRFLVELLRANPQVDVVCVEQSPGMIQQARRALHRQGMDPQRVRFEQEDALTWRPAPGVFDLVVTNFFLDCFRPEELAKLVTQVSASATANARWLVADFRLPERGWRRARGRVVLALMYGFFRYATNLSATRLTPPDTLLETAGFRRTHRRLTNFGLTHADLWRRTNR